MNLHVCAKFGPDRTTGDDVYTVGRIHTHTDRHTHTLSYIDIEEAHLCFIMCKKIKDAANLLSWLFFIHLNIRSDHRKLHSLAIYSTKTV